MKKKLFGMQDGKEIYLYTIENDVATLEVMNYGATVVRFKVHGTDIVGGFDTFEGYLADGSSQGITAGRVCNRIADAELHMDGAIYMLTRGDGKRGNCLHGGVGFMHRVWSEDKTDENSVTLSYYSPDGEDGFPSGLLTKVKFTLSGADLIIEYEAIPEGKTPIALTNHSYFNLDGFGDTVLNHKAEIYAYKYSKVNEKLIPTGEHPSVFGTPFDFSEPHTIGERIGETKSGYDHNFILSPKAYSKFEGKKLALGARVSNGKLALSVYTDQPCIQFYTAGFLGGGDFGDAGKFRGGITPIKYGGFCLEAQTEPNCANHGEAIYDAGEVYRQTTVYSVDKDNEANNFRSQ